MTAITRATAILDNLADKTLPGATLLRIAKDYTLYDETRAIPNE